MAIIKLMGSLLQTLSSRANWYVSWKCLNLSYNTFLQHGTLQMETTMPIIPRQPSDHWYFHLTSSSMLPGAVRIVDRVSALDYPHYVAFAAAQVKDFSFMLEPWILSVETQAQMVLS